MYINLHTYFPGNIKTLPEQVPRVHSDLRTLKIYGGLEEILSLRRLIYGTGYFYCDMSDEEVLTFIYVQYV